MIKMKEKIKKLKRHKTIISKDKKEAAESIINNFKNYINRHNKFKIMQSIVGFKQLF